MVPVGNSPGGIAVSNRRHPTKFLVTTASASDTDVPKNNFDGMVAIVQVDKSKLSEGISRHGSAESEKQNRKDFQFEKDDIVKLKRSV